MSRSDPPETSTSRAALAVSGAMLDLLGAGHPMPMDAEDALSALETVLRDGRDLRPYQVDEVVAFVRDRTASDRDPGSPARLRTPTVESVGTADDGAGGGTQ